MTYAIPRTLSDDDIVVSRRDTPAATDESTAPQREDALRNRDWALTNKDWSMHAPDSHSAG